MSTPLAKQRARTDAEKDQRRANLLASARGLLEERHLDDIKIADVSARAGVAKGTAYIYFPTKETLFLSVLQDELAAMFSALETHLTANTGQADRFASFLAGELASNPLLLDLLSNLHSRLETNLAFDDIKAFKLYLAGQLAHLGALMERAFNLESGKGAGLLLHGFSLAVGLAQFARPTAPAREVLDTVPELTSMKIDFEAEFSQALKQLVDGVSR